MPAFPHHFDSSGLYAYPAAVAGTSKRELTVTAGGSVHTKGSWVEVCSALDVNCCGVLVHSATWQERVLWDLGIGASGNEQVILANAGGQANQDLYRPNIHFYPIAIPKGARVAVRSQANSASSDSFWTFYFIPANFGFSGFGRAATAGADTSNSSGQLVNPGTTANTKGAYTEITSSLEMDCKWINLFLARLVGGTEDDNSWLVDIAIGAAGNEEIILPDLYMFLNRFGNSYYYNRHWGPRVFEMPFSIPVGTRIAARAQSTTIVTDTRNIYVHMLAYG